MTPRPPSRPLRVAALIDTAQVSGPGRQLRALADALRHRGVEVLVISFHRRGQPAPPFARFLAEAGVRSLVLPDNGPLDVGIVASVRAALREFAPDVVQTHSYRTTVVAYLLRRMGARWPWIAFFHGATNENARVRMYHALDRRLMRHADRLVVMSRAHQERFAALGARVRVIHTAVVPLGTAGVAPDLGAMRRAADARPLVGVVGRLSHEKGVDVYLDACASLAERGRAVESVIAGDGPERAALEAQAQRLGLQQRVHFLGTVSAVGALYPQLDLVVLPSRSEGLPNVLLEALLADVPVVATRVGAVPEVLADAAFAPVVPPPGDPAALAAAMERALDGGRTPAQVAARARAAADFSLERRVVAHLALYEEVIGRAQGHVA